MSDECDSSDESVEIFLRESLYRHRLRRCPTDTVCSHCEENEVMTLNGVLSIYCSRCALELGIIVKVKCPKNLHFL